MTVFENGDDRERQRRAAKRIEKAWRCEVEERPLLDPVDWNLKRDGVLRAVGEYKGRTHRLGAFPTLFLAKAKYDALVSEGEAKGVPAFFVAEYEGDVLCYVNVAEIPDTSTRIAGRPPRSGAAHDQEQMIDIPVAMLSVVD